FPLTTLWWSVYVTFDDSRDDPFELCSLYFQNNRYRTVTFGGSSFVRHKEAILGILEFLKENNLPSSTELGDEISKFINLLGGTKPLSFFKREWFKQKLVENYGNGEILLKTSISGTHSLEFKGKGNSAINIIPGIDKSPKKLKYFNINPNGNYSITNLLDRTFENSIKISSEYTNGYLLICYNELGFINRITVNSLLQKKCESYQNGLYNGNTLRKLLLIP